MVPYMTIGDEWSRYLRIGGCLGHQRKEALLQNTSEVQLDCREGKPVDKNKSKIT